MKCGGGVLGCYYYYFLLLIIYFFFFSYVITETATCATIRCKSGQKCLVEKTGRPRCVTCNLPCPESDTLQAAVGKRKDPAGGPVCGNNNKTYRSWCHMFSDACTTGVVIETKSAGQCQVETGKAPEVRAFYMYRSTRK